MVSINIFSLKYVIRQKKRLKIYYVFFFPPGFSAKLHRSFRDINSTQISSTPPSILVNLNYELVRIVSILPPFSNCSKPLFSLLGTVPSVQTTIGITVTRIFLSCFSYLTMTKFCQVFYILWLVGTTNSTWRHLSFFFLWIDNRSDLFGRD